MKISFTANDIRDKMHLNKIINDTVISIFYSPARQGRDYEKIEKSVIQGLTAEQYLIERFNWIKSKNKYLDLVNKNGKVIEIKTSVSKSYLEEQLEVVKKAHWNTSDFYLGFLFDPKTKVYDLVMTENLCTT